MNTLIFALSQLENTKLKFVMEKLKWKTRKEISSTYENVSWLQREAAAASKTVSISAPGRDVFKFSVQSFPNVPFSLKITYPSLLYFVRCGVSNGCALAEFTSSARVTVIYNFTFF